MSDKPTGEPLAEIKHYKSVAGRKVMVTEYVEAGSASAEFLYRMERKRQEAPCDEAIDMRGKVPGVCYAFEFQKLTHYLDEQCRNLFEAAVQEFGGKYTQGVFERVTNAEHSYKMQEAREKTERVKRARLAEQKISAAERIALAPGMQPLEPAHEVEILPFGYSAQRSETRLTYITAVNLYLGEGKPIPAKTADLSLGGCKLALANPVPLDVGRIVGVHFVALQDSERFSHQPIPYRIVKIGEKQGKQLLFVQRQVDESQAYFERFLTDFIEANQRRYKIDLEDSIMALKARVYGQLYGQVLGHVPFFLRGQTLALFGVSSCNGSLLQSPACGPGEFLARLLRPERLAELVRRSAREESLLVYTYTGQRNGKPVLFTGAENEFLSADSRRDFISRGHWAKSLRVYLLRVKPLVPPQAERIQDIMAVLDEKDESLAAKIRSRFQGLSFAGAVFEITEQFEKATDLRARSLDEMADLALEEDAFLNPPGAVAKPHGVRLGYRTRRVEERFVHKTEVELFVGGERYAGETVDFSTRGLKIVLNEPIKLHHRELVKLSLVSLAKVVKDMKLIDLPYQVVSTSYDGKTVCLVREEIIGYHLGSEFFRKLIENNRDKLQEEVSEHQLVAEAQWLESLVGDNLQSLPFVISHDAQHRHWLTRVGISEQADPLLWFFRDESGEFDFAGLGSPTVLKPMLAAAQLLNEKERPKGRIFNAESYVFKQFDAAAGCELMRGTNSLQLKGDALRAFVAAARDKFEHRFLRVQLMASLPYPDAEYEEEMAFIRNNARHRATQLHDEFHTITAFGELVDLTELIAARYEAIGM